MKITNIALLVITLYITGCTKEFSHEVYKAELVKPILPITSPKDSIITLKDTINPIHNLPRLPITTPKKTPVLPPEPKDTITLSIIYDVYVIEGSPNGVLGSSFTLNTIFDGDITFTIEFDYPQHIALTYTLTKGSKHLSGFTNIYVPMDTKITNTKITSITTNKPGRYYFIW